MMDKYSFLNAASSAYFAELYDQYLQSPDSVEPSWRAFFQGFDFGVENAEENIFVDAPAEVSSAVAASGQIPDNLQKEFQVVNLIDGYRTRGHLFTRTNPVRERRKYSPTLDLVSFGLSNADLKTVFNAGEIIGMGPSTLKDIVAHLDKIYCNSIGVEYMYIRDPKERQWIQDKLNANGNEGSFTNEEKKTILKKLNEAVSFEDFLHKKYVGQKRFSLEGGEAFSSK